MRLCAPLVAPALAVVLAMAGVAGARPAAIPRGGASKHAAKLVADGELDAALTEVNQGLAKTPKDLPLLLLRGQVLLLLRDYEGALTAYKAFLAAGATGGNKREVLKIVANLEVVDTTSLAVTASPGPGQIYLDSRTLGLFCEAAPTCVKQILPGKYKVIVEKPGYLRASQVVKIEAGAKQVITLTLTEKPSPLTVTASIAGAEVTIDGKSAGPSPVTRELPAGDHQIGVSLAGHGREQRTVSLHQGEPAALAVPLCELVAIQVTPATAVIQVDGDTARREAGQLCLAPGERTITAGAAGFHPANAVIPAERPASGVALVLTPVGALLSVKGAPAGALLSIDGHVEGPLPLAAPLELPPGDHRFEITHAGMLPYRGQATLRGNTPALVWVTHVRHPGRPKAWILAGGAAAATVAGVVLGVLALGKKTDHDTRAKQAGVTEDDGRLADLKSQSKRYALIGDIAFGVAVVSAGFSTYYFLREGHGLSTGTIQVGAGPGGVSLSATRHF